MVSSIPVVLASDQGNVNVVVNAALPTGSNIIGALSANQSVNITQLGGISIATQGTGIMSVSLVDNTNTRLTSTASALDTNIKYIGQTAILSAVSGGGAFPVGGNQTTGNLVSTNTFPVAIAGSDYGGTPRIQSLKVDSLGQIYLGNSSITIQSNASVNVAQIAGNTTLTGNGVTGTGSQRVTIASDNTAFAVNATLSAETTKVIGTINQGTSPWVVGAPTATGASIPANAFYEGIRGSTALPVAVSDGQLVGIFGDKYGRIVTIAETVRDLKTNITPITLSNTTETTLISQVASTFLDITSIIVNNTSTTAIRVDFRDSTGGTIQFFVECPAQDTRGFTNEFFKQTTVNNNWTAQLSSAVTDVRIAGTYISNK